MNDKKSDVQGYRVVARRRVKGGDGLPRLSYLLMLGTVCDENGPRKSYSLICRGGGDSAVITDATSDKGRALELFSMLVKNTVTPTAVFDVMEELL